MSAGTYADFFRALGQNESGNNYAFVSSLGYLGRFQFGEEALQAIGFYGGDSTWAIDFQGGWTDTAHRYGVWDKQSFLNSAAAQDAAADAWFQKVWSDVTALNLQAYEGQWIAGIQITKSGLLAGAHLVGVWNLKDFLSSGGAVDTRDGYGTPVSQYVGKFGGYDTPFGPASGGGGGGGGNTGWSANQVLQGSDGYDALSGGDGHDTIAGGAGHNVLRGEGGSDKLVGGWQFDDLHGNLGDDTVSGGFGDDWVVGGQGQDLLLGEDGHDVVYGNIGNDTVNGNEGNDWVRGGQGDDLIDAGGGADFVAGDRGSDTITGGAGGDLFHIFSGDGVDRILDFNYAEGDRVDVLDGHAYSTWQGADGAVIDFGAGGQTVLVGVSLWSLPSDWIF